MYLFREVGTYGGQEVRDVGEGFFESLGNDIRAELRAPVVLVLLARLFLVVANLVELVL